MAYEIQTLSKKQFPALLQEINDPPDQLFLRGKIPNKNAKHLCVVGSRHYSRYGKDACEKIVSGLRGHNVVIVSGLAIGIDSISHKAALDADIATVAVLGSGLGWDVIYPRTSLNLAKKILETGGALLSEFEENFKATPWSFPQRNRLMAGMSHAVLVIEAQGKSGTLITARLATEYNRDVFVVPGSILAENSKGSNRLIRMGATPVTTSEEILEELGIPFDSAQGRPWPGRQDLSEEENRVIELLREPMARDELIQGLKMLTSEANILLSAMEIKGIIVERLGKVRLA